MAERNKNLEKALGGGLAIKGAITKVDTSRRSCANAGCNHAAVLHASGPCDVRGCPCRGYRE